MAGENSSSVVPRPTMMEVMKTGISVTTVEPGFGFHPTDEELVCFHLKSKVENKPVPFEVIAEIDFYNHEPWELPDKSILKEKNQEYWYFFCLLEKKFENGEKQLKRATNQGFWKPTGRDRVIYHNSKLIGMKRSLVFYIGRPKTAQRTDWVIHEYRLVEGDHQLGRNRALQGYVLCKLFHKNNIGSLEIPYAHFNEAEEDEDDVVDGNDVIATNHVAVDVYPVLESNGFGRTGFEQDLQNVDKGGARNNEVSRESLNERIVPPVPPHNVERLDDWLSLGMPNTQAHLPYKRKQPNDSEGAATEAETARISPSSMTTTTFSTLLEFPILESVELEENPSVPPPTYDTSNLESEVPPGCMNIINQLRNEIHNISLENEATKLEIMSAHTKINILKSILDSVRCENEDLKRNKREP
ncbi:hypothetical protein DITRI_Ditri09bG0095800 [Diplodiscus trichospermus]